MALPSDSIDRWAEFAAAKVDDLRVGAHAVARHGFAARSESRASRGVLANERGDVIESAMHHRLGLGLAFSISLLTACAQQDADANSTEYIILLSAEGTATEPTFELTTEQAADPERVLGRVSVIGEDEPTLTVALEGVDAELVVVVEDGPRALWWDDEALEPEVDPVDARQRLALRVAGQVLDELGVVETSFRCWPKQW